MKKKVVLRWSDMTTKQRVFYVLDWVIRGFWILIAIFFAVTCCVTCYRSNSGSVAYADFTGKDVTYIEFPSSDNFYGEDLNPAANLRLSVDITSFSGLWDTVFYYPLTITTSTTYGIDLYYDFSDSESDSDYIHLNDWTIAVYNCDMKTMANMFCYTSYDSKSGSSNGPYMASFDSRDDFFYYHVTDFLTSASLNVYFSEPLTTYIFLYYGSYDSDILENAYAYASTRVYYNEGYEAGHTAGYDSGYNAGYYDGEIYGFNRGEEVGFDSGRTFGFNQGYSSGLYTGEAKGLSGIFANSTLSGLTYDSDGTKYTFSGIEPDYFLSGISLYNTYRWCETEGFVPLSTELTINLSSSVTLNGDLILYSESSFTACTFTFNDGTISVIDAFYITYDSSHKSWSCTLDYDSLSSYALKSITLYSNTGYSSDGSGLMQSTISYKSDDLAQSYANGYNTGYTSGSSDGYESGYTAGKSDGYDSGYSAGTSDGYSSGKSDGYDSGYSAGSSDGYDTGYSAGSSDGYTTGYGAGHTAGYSDGFNDNGTGGFSWLISSVQSFLNTSFFGDFGIGTLLYVGLGATLVCMFLKLFA